MSDIYPKPRREAVLRVSLDLLVAMCQSGDASLVRCLNPIPATATIRHTAIDHYSGGVMVLLADESFAPVEDACEAPRLDARFERVYACELAGEARAAADSIDASWDGVYGVTALLRRLADVLDPTAVKL